MNTFTFFVFFYSSMSHPSLCVCDKSDKSESFILRFLPLTQLSSAQQSDNIYSRVLGSS